MISGGANSAAPTTLECFLQDTAFHRREDAQLFVQAYSLTAVAARLPVKPNLEAERKEDENDALLRGAKKITSAK